MSANHQTTKILEDQLNRALNEALSKVNEALATDQGSSSDMKTRRAAEAVEYSSALFSLTYGLEDFDPAIRLDKKADPLALVEDAVQELQRVRELSRTSTKEAYTSLRAAADHLKLAYLGQAKKSATKPS